MYISCLATSHPYNLYHILYLDKKITLWFYGILASWHLGILASWHIGILAFWHLGILASWHLGILEFTRCHYSGIIKNLRHNPSLLNFLKFRWQMAAVVLYLTNTPAPEVPAIHMLTLPPKMTMGLDFLISFSLTSSYFTSSYWTFISRTCSSWTSSF